MSHTRFQRSIAAILVATTLALPIPATAGLKDALDSMFLSNTTSPGAIQTQLRGGATGGSLAIRAPIRNITLISFDPPRISAGCGGIDLFGGSFSFINADQLVALFRQIAANAVGAAFMLAIKNISPTLAGIMEKFQAVMQSLNGLMRNTCSLANMVVNKAVDVATNTTQESSSLGEAWKGLTDDLSGAWNKLISSPNEGVKKMAQEGSCPMCGNLTWKALSDSNAGSMLGNPATSETSPESANMLLMSLLGTVIMPNQEEADKTDSAGKVTPQGGTEYAATLQIWNFYYGSSDTFQTWKCTGSDNTRTGCLTITKTDTAFKGMLTHVHDMLLGSGVSNGGYTSDSIVGKLISCSGATCGFTSSQIQFLNGISQPAVGLLRSVQHSNASVAPLAEAMVPVIAIDLTFAYGRAAQSAARSAWSGVKDNPMPQIVADQLAQLSGQMNALMAVQQGSLKTMNDLYATADNIIKRNPAVFAQAGSGAGAR